MIKYILWDIDGTLLDFEVAEKNSIYKCFEKFNLGVCTEEMLKEYSKINIKYWQMLERGEINKKQVLEGRFKEFFENHKIDTSIISDFNLYYQECLGNEVAFNENAEEVVKELNKKYKQVAVTNGTKLAQDNKLKKSGLDKIFEKVYISEVVGFEKPAVEFFDRVFDYTGRNKEEILIVGDSLTSDMQGGINAGIKTCWYNPDNKENSKTLNLDYEIKDLIEVLDIVKNLEIY